MAIAALFLFNLIIAISPFTVSTPPHVRVFFSTGRENTRGRSMPEKSQTVDNQLFFFFLLHLKLHILTVWAEALLSVTLALYFLLH